MKLKEILNPEMRKELSSKWKAQDKPVNLYDSYLVYESEAGGPFLVGLNSAEANNLERVFQEKGIEHVRIDGEYPYEFLQYWQGQKK